MATTREATTTDRAWRRHDRRGTVGLLAGPLLWLLLFFVIPVAFVAAYSVGAVDAVPDRHRGRLARELGAPAHRRAPST